LNSIFDTPDLNALKNRHSYFDFWDILVLLERRKEERLKAPRYKLLSYICVSNLKRLGANI